MKKYVTIGITFLNCLHSFRPKNKLESDEKVCDNKDFAIF